KLPACGSNARVAGLPVGATRKTALGDAGRIAKTVSGVNPNHEPVGSDGTATMYASAPGGGAKGGAAYSGERSDCVPSGRTRNRCGPAATTRSPPLRGPATSTTAG